MECSDGQIGYGRKRRDVSTLPAKNNKIFEISITSFIKINFNNKTDTFEETIDNRTTIYNNNKFIVGKQMDRRFYKTIEETPSNMGITKLTEEELITSIVAENAAVHSRFVASVLTLGIVLRLLL